MIKKINDEDDADGIDDDDDEDDEINNVDDADGIDDGKRWCDEADVFNDGSKEKMMNDAIDENIERMMRDIKTMRCDVKMASNIFDDVMTMMPMNDDIKIFEMMRWWASRFSWFWWWEDDDADEWWHQDFCYLMIKLILLTSND